MSLEQYLKEIGKIPLLKPDEERKYAVLAKQGDAESKDLLIRSNLRLVVSVAKRYSRDESLLMDLIQEGNMGLMKAIERFEPGKNHRLSTYATWWIRERIFSHLDSKSLIIIPSNQRATMRRVYNIIGGYLATHGEEPSCEYIAEKLSNIEKKKYSPERIIMFLQGYEKLTTSSLNSPIGEDQKTERIDLVAGTDGKEAFEKAAGESTQNIIYQQIQGLGLDNTARGILEGILHDSKCFEELQSEFGLTREQVKSKYNRSLCALRNALKTNPQFADIHE